MGTYRLLLALLVAFSHIGGRVAGWNPGVSAVISFFIISGLAMTALIRSDFHTPSRVKSFYVERAIRLLPHFAFYLVVTLVIFATVGIQAHDLSQLTLGKVFLNFLVVPLNFYMFGDLATGMLIPQAWSLGLEVTFYALLPWLLLKNLRLVAFFVSLFVFALAYFDVLNANLWGYRFLPGVLFIFLLGSFIHKPTSEKLRLLACAWFVTLGLLLGLFLFPNTKHDLVEVLFGILAGLPIVLALRNFRGSSMDKLMGHISYGVFLNHFAVLWFLESTGFGRPKQPVEMAVFFFICVVLGAFSYFMVERPLLIVQRKIRSSSGDEAVNASKVLRTY